MGRKNSTVRWAAVTLFVVLGAHVRAQGPVQSGAASDGPALTAEQVLKADLFKLKVENAQLRATLADRESRLASYVLSAEQAALAAEFLKQMQAPAGAEWDWERMAVKQPEQPPEPDKAAPKAPKEK